MSTERPILFSRPMVQARRAGLKTQTRRIMKFQPDPEWTEISVEFKGGRALATYRAFPGRGSARWGICECQYGTIGDRLWHRETWGTTAAWNHYKPSDLPIGIEDIFYAADVPAERLEGLKPWRPSLFLPRRYCRWVDEITDVRVERLQDISEEDAIAEGVERFLDGYKCYDGTYTSFFTARDSFFSLWRSINGAESYLSNPWVWALTLKEVPT